MLRAAALEWVALRLTLLTLRAMIAVASPWPAGLLVPLDRTSHLAWGFRAYRHFRDGAGGRL